MQLGPRRREVLQPGEALGTNPVCSGTLPCWPPLDSQNMTYAITAAAGTGGGHP